MTNEEFQKLVLKELESMGSGQKELKEDVSNIKKDISNVREDISNVKGQLNENTQIVKALRHRTEELDAKFDGLLTTTATKEAIANLATKEDIAALDSKFEVLNSRLFHQEAELHRLKAVK